MTIKVPLKSLRLPGTYPGMAGEGGKEKEILPEVQDPVSFSVEGVVTAVDGDAADVEIRFVNGERPAATSAGREAKSAKSEEEFMAEAAEAADLEEGY
jgi:hypothetical protein